MTHPARKYVANHGFQKLYYALQLALAEGLVREVSGPEGLRLYCYTDICVYERRWDEVTLMARGLILDTLKQQIVATPFPKFFNHGEEAAAIIPDQAFETFEKLDGSLIIIFNHNGEWKTATKGSFISGQSVWAMNWLKHFDNLDPSVTYLAEAIYPENRIVVHYPECGLFLLGAYRKNGTELSYEELQGAGLTVVKRHGYSSILELLETAGRLTSQNEGFMLRFADGQRLKIKGDEYCHMVSRLTPLAIWESMLEGKEMEELRKQLPEEFWADFDKIIELLNRNINNIVEVVAAHSELLKDKSDKEVGLQLKELPEEVRRFIFQYRKNKGDLLSGRSRRALFQHIRPDGNRLAGYAPSSSVNRIKEELWN